MKAKFELTLANVGSVYDFALGLGEKKAQDQCLVFADLNSERLVINNEVFKKLSFEFISELVSRDSFYVREVELFNALLHWQKNNRTYELYEILKDLRWNLIPSDEFAVDVRPLKIVSDTQYFESFANPLPPRVSAIPETLAIKEENSDDIPRVKLERNSIEEVLFDESSVSETNRERTNSTTETVDVIHEYPRLIDDELQLLNIVFTFCDKVDFAPYTVDSRVVELILKVVKRKVEARICDDLLYRGWKSLVTLMTRQENCQFFLSNDGVQHIVDCFHLFSETKTLSCLLMVIKIIVEHSVEELIKPFLIPEILTRIIGLTTDPNVGPDYHYVCTYIMLLIIHHRQLFHDEAPFCDRSILLEKLRSTVQSWPLDRSIRYEEIRLAPMLVFAKSNDELAFKSFALWSFAYFTKLDPGRYCSNATLKEVYEIMNETESEDLKMLGNQAVLNVNEYLRKQMPPVHKRKKILKPPGASKVSKLASRTSVHSSS